MDTDRSPAAPPWGRIVSRGEETITYCGFGVEITKITYGTWYVVQVSWHRWAEPQDILKAVATIPKGAVLRHTKEQGLRSSSLTHEELCEAFYPTGYIQWEPIEEVMTLANVG